MPDKFGLFSIKEIITDSRRNGIKPMYVLMGSDLYLQSFFVNQIVKIFNNKNISKQSYSFEETDPIHIINEITGISLFADPRVFVLRGLKKISKNYMSELIEWGSYPRQHNCVIIVKNEFDLKNSYIKKLRKNIQLIDTRTPFPNKIRDWVKYILKLKKINLPSNIIENLIENCGDSIANIENEIEKILIDNIENNHENNSLIEKKIKDYPIWRLIDSLGRKDINNSFKIYINLWINNIPTSQILFNLSFFYQELIWVVLGNKNTQIKLNYQIKKNMNIYLKKYNFDELKNIILDIRKIDFDIKNFSLSERDIMLKFIVKACKGYDESF